jgi:hypothetical protein
MFLSRSQVRVVHAPVPAPDEKCSLPPLEIKMAIPTTSLHSNVSTVLLFLTTIDDTMTDDEIKQTAATHGLIAATLTYPNVEVGTVHVCCTQFYLLIN